MRVFQHVHPNHYSDKSATKCTLTLAAELVISTLVILFLHAWYQCIQSGGLTQYYSKHASYSRVFATSLITTAENINSLWSSAKMVIFWRISPFYYFIFLSEIPQVISCSCEPSIRSTTALVQYACRRRGMTAGTVSKWLWSSSDDSRVCMLWLRAPTLDNSFSFWLVSLDCNIWANPTHAIKNLLILTPF